MVLNGEKRAGLVLQCIGEMVKRRGVGMNDDIKAMASSFFSCNVHCATPRNMSKRIEFYTSASNKLEAGGRGWWY